MFSFWNKVLCSPGLTQTRYILEDVSLPPLSKPCDYRRATLDRDFTVAVSSQNPYKFCRWNYDVKFRRVHSWFVNPCVCGTCLCGYTCGGQSRRAGVCCHCPRHCETVRRSLSQKPTIRLGLLVPEPFYLHTSVLGLQAHAARPDFYSGCRIQTQGLMLAQNILLPSEPSLPVPAGYYFFLNIVFFNLL